MMISTRSEYVLEAPNGATSVGPTGEPEALVELRGEFDVFELQRLRDALDRASGLGTPVTVGLSEVTFLDARCARELALRHRDGRLKLRDISWRVERSLEVCGVARMNTAGKTGCRVRGRG